MTAPHSRDITDAAEVADRQVDWLLGERLGHEIPPDLTDRVLARLAMGDDPGARATHRAAHRTRAFLVAAVLLLGLAAVLGVALRGGPTVVPVSAPLQDPAPGPVIRTVEDVAALPAATRAVEALEIDDAVLRALTRLRELEHLTVRNPTAEVSGPIQQMAAPHGDQSITDAGLEHLAALPRLRTLHLSGTWGVTGSGLAHLPRLEDLALRYLDVEDQHLEQLAKMPGLRRLDLSFNHGFDDGGTAAIARCRGLRELSVRGCQQLGGARIARFAALPELQRLDAGLTDGRHWRVDTRGGEARQQLLRERAEELARQPDRGVTDAALRSLAAAPALRVLRVDEGRYGEAGVAELSRLTTLEDLDIGGADLRVTFLDNLPKGLRRLRVRGGFTNDFCRGLRAVLPDLEELDISGCFQITDAGLAHLVALPKLRVLSVARVTCLYTPAIDLLAQARQIEELDLRGLLFVTAAHLAQLRAGMTSLRVLRADVPEQDPEGALPPPVLVKSRAEIDALPDSVRNLIGVDLTDEAMDALPRLQKLERVVLRALWTPPVGIRGKPEYRSISDAGLRHLQDLTVLRVLELHGQTEVLGPGLDVVARLPALRELHLEQTGLTDAALAFLRQRPELERVALVHCQGFGRAGIEVLTELPRLRHVSLRGCTHLDDTAIARLGALQDLELLDLAMIGSRTIFTGRRLNPLPEPQPGSGVTDRALAGLATLTKLRVLNLGVAGITGDGLRHLSGLVALDHLDLSDVDELRPADLERLPAGLTSLTLRGLPKLDAELGPLLARTLKRLRTLDLLGCTGLQDDMIEGLATIHSLRSLDLSYCPDFTMDAVEQLLRVSQLEGLTIRGWKFLDAALTGRIEAMPGLRRLDTDAGTKRLR